MDKDKRPYMNTRQLYHKGKWKNKPKEKSRGSTKIPRKLGHNNNGRRKKYTFKKNPSPHLHGCASVHE